MWFSLYFKKVDFKSILEAKNCFDKFSCSQMYKVDTHTFTRPYDASLKCLGRVKIGGSGIVNCYFIVNVYSRAGGGGTRL